MFFNSLSEFLAMGGHGLYVWLCYGAVLAVLVLNVLLPMTERRQILRAQSQRLRREEAGL